MTAVEEYTAHHAETMEEILHKWGWRRFERMFRLHLLRKARDELRRMRDLRLAAMDANTNYDSSENQNAKTARTDALHQAYLDAERTLYSAQPDEPEPEDDYGDDPLFAPLRRRAGQLQQEISRPLAPQSGMGRDLIEAT